MEVALGWLGDVVRAILLIFPRLIIIRTTHEGVKWVCGKRVRLLSHENGVLGTGLHVLWPLVTQYEIVPTKRQTTNLEAQYLHTKDGKSVGVSGILVYEVENTVALLTECYDYEDTIKDLALAAIKKVIVDNSFQFLRDEPHLTDEQLTEQLSNDLDRFGIETIRVTLTDFTEMFVLGTWGS